MVSDLGVPGGLLIRSQLPFQPLFGRWRERRTVPLIYQRHGDNYLLVASNGGGDPPRWLLNLQADPTVEVQVKADHHSARARLASAEEKPELWRIMTATGTPYDEFQAKADWELPVVVLEPV